MDEKSSQFRATENYIKENETIKENNPFIVIQTNSDSPKITSGKEIAHVVFKTHRDGWHYGVLYRTKSAGAAAERSPVSQPRVSSSRHQRRRSRW